MSIDIVIGFSILFFLSEFILMITKRSKKEGTKIQKDKRSLLLFWIIIPLALSMGFFAAKYGEWNSLNKALAILGLCISLAGFVIRWKAIIQLKKEFTVDISVHQNHQLKKDGMYKRLRHPSYLGLLLICSGLSASMNNLISFLAITIPLILVLFYRIKIEEEILIKEFGDIYRDYMKETRKIIPGIY